jgi:hypothetical protein
MYELLGALVPTFLISRLFLWPHRKWREGVLRVFVANIASLAVCFVLAGFGYADGGPFAWQRALAGYLLPQIVWLIFDLAMLAKKRNAPPQP